MITIKDDTEKLEDELTVLKNILGNSPPNGWSGAAERALCKAIQATQVEIHKMTAGPGMAVSFNERLLFGLGQNSGGQKWPL